MRYHDYLDKIEELEKQMYERLCKYPFYCDDCRLDFKLKEVYYQIITETYTTSYGTFLDKAAISLCCPKCLQNLNTPVVAPHYDSTRMHTCAERYTNRILSKHLHKGLCVHKYGPVKIIPIIIELMRCNFDDKKIRKVFTKLRNEYKFFMTTSEIIKKYKLK